MCYNVLIAPPTEAKEGGDKMLINIIINLTVSITAGIICHYICKWLDGHGK